MSSMAVPTAAVIATYLVAGCVCKQGPVFISTDRYDNPLERTNIDPPCLTLDRREIITSTASFAMKKELKQDPV